MAEEKKYDSYATAYLTIQTSYISLEVKQLIETLVVDLNKQGILMYVSVQQGKPGNPPPCPPAGCH